MNPRLPLADINKVPNYGRRFPFVPWKTSTRLRVSWVFVRHLLAELGLLRLLSFCLLLPWNVWHAQQRFSEGVQLMGQKFGWLPKAQWLLLLVIYQDIEARHGKAPAYRLAKDAIQACSLFMMPEFYQSDHLARFEDPFEAFWAYHKAMFAGDGNYPNEMVEEGDLRMMIVRDCRNCQIARLTVPELATLGCDHDISGYPAIEATTHMQFRRPKTLAKDDEPCRFMFYRAGTAPPGAYENH